MRSAPVTLSTASPSRARSWRKSVRSCAPSAFKLGTTGSGSSSAYPRRNWRSPNTAQPEKRRAMTRGSRPALAAATCRWMAVSGAALLSFFMSARDAEPAKCPDRGVVTAVHDAVPAAAARCGDVLCPIVDEHGLRWGQRKTPLSLDVDPLVRLHHAGDERGQRAVPDAMQLVFTRQVAPMQVADVGQQIDAVALAQAAGERHHPRLQLEHIHPARVRRLQVHWPRGERGAALEQSAAIHAPALVIIERDTREHRLEVGRVRAMGRQEIEEGLVIQMNEYPADVENDVTNQAASVSRVQPLYGGAARADVQ